MSKIKSFSFEDLSRLDLCVKDKISTNYRPVGRNFQRGGSLDTAGVWGPLKAPRSPWVFDAKSCNLAISSHFIQSSGKPCFPLLFFKDFHQILHQLGL